MNVPIRERLRAALTQAMRDRDREVVRALRLALAALDNAEAIPITAAPRAGALEHATVGVGRADAPRRNLTEETMRAIVADEEADLRAAAAQLRDADPARGDELVRGADALRATLAVGSSSLD